jgi:membrane-associated phospholipid phosphatase
MSIFFDNLPKNILKCFKGYNILWHLLAIILTYIIVTSGFDWLYLKSTRSILLQSILFPAVRLGSRVPIFVPLVLYAAGKARDNLRTIKTAGALAQAALIGLLIAAVYKAFTGRVHPPRLLDQNTVDSSRNFLFGFMRNGIFWGWPSSHTTVAFAMSVALIMMYPKNNIIRYTAMAYALYIGFGVSISIHWFSDFIAGAIIGSVIGVVVGKSFRDKITERHHGNKLT